MDRTLRIAALLKRHYPEPPSFLHYRTPFELLIGVILSAQTTDRAVNSLTPALFARFPTAAAMALADRSELETLIYSVGFFRAKARAIHATARLLMECHNGQVPATMSELLRLPGVGRKSANVVVGTLFGQPAVIVDTHFSRVVRRLGLTPHSDPRLIEHAIGILLPSQKQYHFSMAINLHGRTCCTARSPNCDACILRDLCPYPKHDVLR